MKRHHGHAPDLRTLEARAKTAIERRKRQDEAEQRRIAIERRRQKAVQARALLVELQHRQLEQRAAAARREHARARFEPVHRRLLSQAFDDALALVVEPYGIEEWSIA